VVNVSRFYDLKLPTFKPAKRHECLSSFFSRTAYAPSRSEITRPITIIQMR